MEICSKCLVSEQSENTFMTHPVAGFLVDDIVAARAEMEAKGIEFIGPIEGDTDDYKWTHFRAPDGFVYELTYSTVTSIHCRVNLSRPNKLHPQFSLENEECNC